MCRVFFIGSRTNQKNHIFSAYCIRINNGRGSSSKIDMDPDSKLALKRIPFRIKSKHFTLYSLSIHVHPQNKNFIFFKTGVEKKI